MKKIFLILMTMFIFSECYAFEYEYSEWSPIYPGKVKDEIFIEEEDRFLWYKEVEKDIKYKRIDDINDNIMYDSNDIKYETNYMFIEPIKYKERTYKRVLKDYVFSNSDIDGILFENIGDINISEVEVYLNENKSDFNGTHKALFDGKYDYINYKNKIIKMSLNEFNESIKLVIYYNSLSDQTIDISYRVSDRYNVYSNTISFDKCDNCTKEIIIDNFKSYRNQYISLYEYTDKLYKTYKLGKEYTDDYYSNLDGYIKDESTLKKYYRFIMNDYIILDKNNNVVHDTSYCSKEACFIKYQDKEIENPKTNDNIYLYSSSFILIIFLIIKKYLVLSKRNMSFNNYSII